MGSKTEKSFSIFVAGQGILNLGESIRFIAITILIYNITGSGLSAATGVVMSALPSILASPFAGVLGDRIHESRLLIVTDLARFLVIPLFLYADRISVIYLLLILTSILDVFYGPSKKKFILGITGRDGAIKANSELTGVSGAAYLIGPMVSGFLTDSYGPAPALIISGVCCLISCVMTIFTVIAQGGYNRSQLSGVYENGLAQLRIGLKYCISSPKILELLIIGLVTGLCTISVNLTFYPFAFDTLKVTAKGWSLMITIYYGTNLVAMLLVGYLHKRYKKFGGSLFYAGLGIVAFIWVMYAFSGDYAIILLLQFMEGSVIAVCGILLAARFQMITDKSYMARVSSINDIFSSIGKLAGMGCTIILTRSVAFSWVFVLSGFCLLIFIVFNKTKTRWV